MLVIIKESYSLHSPGVDPAHKNNQQNQTKPIQTKPLSLELGVSSPIRRHREGYVIKNGIQKGANYCSDWEKWG